MTSPIEAAEAGVAYDCWLAIMNDPQLARARQRLSIHEIRLMILHAKKEEWQKAIKAAADRAALTRQGKQGTTDPYVMGIVHASEVIEEAILAMPVLTEASRRASFPQTKEW